jgi:hypothetical protein
MVELRANAVNLTNRQTQGQQRTFFIRLLPLRMQRAESMRMKMVRFSVANPQPTSAAPQVGVYTRQSKAMMIPNDFSFLSPAARSSMAGQASSARP